MGFKGELPDNRLIYEGSGKNPLPLWTWFFVLVCVLAVFWGVGSWWSKERHVEMSSKPFLQVTNREFSLFLWQFPQYMRANYSAKMGYLEAFRQLGDVSVAPADADAWVQAPPEVLFLYHTWDRLLKEAYIPRAIAKEEFLEFLNQVTLWNPQFWPQAPEKYKQWVAGLATGTTQNLEQASKLELPIAVRQAFQGWRNYFKEGAAIDAVKPTYGEMQAFLNASPHYARHYWRNILLSSRPNYLNGTGKPEEEIPADQLDGFLKVAYFNYVQAREGN